MLFKVTHIDPAGHRHKARVTGANARDAMEQMDQRYGEARGGACVRLTTHPVLRPVGRANAALHETGRVACGF